MTTTIPSVGIILTHNRPELLAQCVAAAGSQVDYLVVIDNASDPPVELADVESIIAIPDQPPNISKMWATALILVRGEMRIRQVAAWNVALVCDDVILPDGWVQIVATGLREHNAAAACTHPINPIRHPLIKSTPDSDIMNRMTPHAFMIAGENAALKPHPDLQWWWCDTHLDWLARQHGGMVILPGPVAVNSRPNEFTVGRPELGEQAGRDGKTFEQIWSWRPW